MKTGFCADSFEIGQGIANSRILLPKLINDISYKIQDVRFRNNLDKMWKNIYHIPN